MRPSVMMYAVVVLIAGNFYIQPCRAQDIKKDVTVVKPYQPVVQDFSKINLMPVIADTTPYTIQYAYRINSIKLEAPYSPRPISMAKLGQETVPFTQNNYIMTAIGNPWSPLVEASFNSGRSGNSSWGILFRHTSAKGSVQLRNSPARIEAPYKNTMAGVQGKYLTKKSAWSSQLKYQSNTYYYYGIDPVSAPIYNADTFRQHLQTGFATLNLTSLNRDSDRLQYGAALRYQFFADRYDHMENQANLNAQLGKMLPKFYGGINIVNQYLAAAGKDDSSYVNLFTLRPYAEKSGKEWKISGGLNITSDKHFGGTILYVFPFASFDFVVLPRVIKINLSYDGYVKPNSYHRLLDENPYIKPGTFGKSTSCNSAISATLSGILSDEIHYSLSGRYENVKNQAFFINATDSPFYNWFVPVYDNVELMKMATSLTFKISSKAQLNLVAQYHHFDLLRQKKPWGLPAITANSAFVYNIRNKIIATTQLYFVGARYAQDPLTTAIVTLKPFVNLNQKLEYRYTEKFSLYLELKNITASRYAYWNQYTHYRFQAFVGVMFLF